MEQPVSESTSVLYSKLSELNIEYQRFDHAPAATCEDLKSIFGSQPFQHAKNIFLHDKNKRLFVVTALSSSPVNLKALSSQLKAPNLRFASEDNMKKHLGVLPGAVTPLAAINDSQNAVTFVFDSSFKTSTEPILVHPLINTASLAVAMEDLVMFMKATGHDVVWTDLNEKSEGATPVSNGSVVNQLRNKALDKKSTTPTATTAQGGTEMLGITVKKEDNFSEWYSQIITRADMVDYYDISGCYILRPWSYFMWETIQEFFNANIKRLGVQNAYFPMFVTKNKLETEKEHVAGFSPEVAWVTKYGDSDLAEPIAIRPTSETIMYPAYSRWIRSHRDLPLKLNQWCQVVRWEFKQPTPFIRTREFLWQEGHTAHATAAEAETFTFTILDLYARVYEELLAVPVIKGIKTEKEKFAGGRMTTTIETFIPTNGRGVQAATSHDLGTNFSRMFNIEFEDQHRQKQFAHQTSWGLTTRSLGVAVMVHGDNKGMVMPPKVAPIQVAIVPIVYKTEEETDSLLSRCNVIADELSAVGIRVKVDDRDNYTPGWKYNDWETKGVCLRMEIGPRDMKARTARLVRRDTNEKSDYQWDQLASAIPRLLEDIHQSMFSRAKRNLNDSIVKVTSWSEVMPALNAKKMVLAPWCEDGEMEEEVKKETTRLTAEILSLSGESLSEEPTSALTGGMKSLCYPLEQDPLPEGSRCFFSDKPAKRWCLFGRSY